MSSEIAGEMSEESKEKSVLVPRLRFPEFHTQKPWEFKELAQLLTTISNGVSLPQNSSGPGLRVTRIETIADGTIDLDRVGYVDAMENELEEYRLSIGDVLISNINSIAHIGKSVFIDADHDLYHGMNLLRLRVDTKSNSPQFIYFSINAPAVRSSIRGRANKAVNQASINQTELGRTIIPSPSRAEQQKIADCLSSLDELITAETQKLSALKTHKKGLMQQLFPREGETVPRLRFPEFREAGEWKRKELGEIATVVASGDLDAVCFSPVKTDEHIYPVYSNAVEEQGLYGYYSVPKFPKNSITITARGTLGVAFARPNEFMGIGRLLVVSNFKNIDPRFICECWNHLGKVPAEVTSIPQFTAVAAKATSLPIPNIEEQHKIAACLSSLDDLITAQSQKIDALKTHKRGLMQQLFPVQDEELG